jgi:hypothetical protein
MYFCALVRALRLSFVWFIRVQGKVLTAFELSAYVDNFIDHLTSNQVGLPAELKHINKRRKRN